MRNFFIFLILLTGATFVMADTVTFEVTVNQSKISLNEVLQLTLTVTGAKEDVPPINLPAIDGFSARYIGPSTSVSIINGDYHRERSFIYNLFPNKAGRFQIPSMTVTVGGQILRSKPVAIDVLDKMPVGPSDQNQTQDQEEGSEGLKDKILINIIPGKTRAYLNERIPLTIKLFIKDLAVRDIQYPQFEKNGFTIDDFEKPGQYSQVIHGIKYDIVEFKTFLYPTHAGTVTIGPVQIGGNIIYKQGNSNPFKQDNSWQENIFSNFFESYVTRPVTVTSQSLFLDVSALPTENVPSDFYGAVGQFDFQANVSPRQVKVGDPLTLKMRWEGQGYFKGLKIPAFQTLNFKTYELKLKDEDNGKTGEQVIIPLSPTIKEVPALRFSYFDPQLEEYKTITQGPFPIHVTASSPEQEFKAMGFSDLSRETVMPRTSYFSIWKIWAGFNKALKKILSSFRFWLGLTLILVGGFIYLVWQRFLEKLERDPAFARRLRAVKEARETLRRAKDLLTPDKMKDFYGLLSKILRGYLAHKWRLSLDALSHEEISRRLKSAGVDEASIHQLETLLENSDLVCFASLTRDVACMQKDYTLVQHLINHLEGHLK